MIGRSEIPRTTPRVRMALRIKNWTIRGDAVTMQNFQTNQLGQLNIDAVYWGEWSILSQ